MIRLKDHEPDLFQAFVHWIDTKEIDLLHLVRPDGTKCLFPPWLSMGKLWALAHYLDHTPLRDATIDAMLHKMRGHPDVAIAPESLNAIFDTTPENSTIQRLLWNSLPPGTLGLIPSERYQSYHWRSFITWLVSS